MAGLQSAKWQERLEGMGTVLERAGGSDVDPGVLIQCLGYLPGWADKNFQVLNKVYEAVAAAAVGPLSKRDATLAVEGMADKLAELKHRLVGGGASLRIEWAEGNTSGWEGCLAQTRLTPGRG